MNNKKKHAKAIKPVKNNKNTNRNKFNNNKNSSSSSNNNNNKNKCHGVKSIFEE
jgi:hypothetical protein